MYTNQRSPCKVVSRLSKKSSLQPATFTIFCTYFSCSSLVRWENPDALLIRFDFHSHCCCCISNGSERGENWRLPAVSAKSDMTWWCRVKWVKHHRLRSHSLWIRILVPLLTMWWISYLVSLYLSFYMWNGCETEKNMNIFLTVLWGLHAKI